MRHLWPVRTEPVTEWQATLDQLSRWFAPYDMLPISPVTPALTILRQISYGQQAASQEPAGPQPLRRERPVGRRAARVDPAPAPAAERPGRGAALGGTGDCPACGAYVPVGQDGVPLAHERFAPGSGYGADQPHQRVRARAGRPGAAVTAPGPPGHNGWSCTVAAR